MKLVPTPRSNKTKGMLEIHKKWEMNDGCMECMKYSNPNKLK
jgi:hypothetical protein